MFSNRRMLSNTVWLLIDRTIRLAGGVLVYVLIARYLGVGNFGILNYALAIVAVAGVVAGLGLNGVLVKDLVVNSDETDVTVGTALALRVVAGLMAATGAVAFAKVMRPNDSLFLAVTAILSSLLILRIYHVFNYFFESRTQGRVYVVAENVAFLIASVLKISLLLLGYGLISITIAVIFEAFVAAVLMFLAYSRYQGLRRLACGSGKRIASLLKRSLPLMFSGLALILYMRIDQIMLGWLADDRSLGVYSAASRIFEVWFFLPTIICVSIFPNLLRVRGLDVEKYNRLVESLYTLLIVLGGAIAIVLTAASPLVETLFGSDFAGASSVLIILSWASVFAFLGFASGRWYIAEGLEKYALLRNLGGLVVASASNLILIPLYQETGAAIGTLLAFFCSGYLFDGIGAVTRPAFRHKNVAFSPSGSVARTKEIAVWLFQKER